MTKIFIDWWHFKNYTKLQLFFKWCKKLILLTDWEKDSNYKKQWYNNFSKKLKIIYPNKDKKYLKKIKKAEWVLIWGWKTELFSKYYNNSKTKKILLNKKRIFWTSAWAMILWNSFWLKWININWEKISSKMSEYKWKFKIKKWLWLINKVIWVHIKESDELKATKEVMKLSWVKKWIWLDENTYLVLNKWKIKEKNWDWKVYKIKN